MLPQHQQGVPQLEVGHPFDAGAHAGIAHHRPADEAAAPSGGIGPEGELAFLAVREIALVEDANLLGARPPNEHQSAVWVPGIFEARLDRRRCIDRAEVRVDHRKGVVADVGRRQADMIAALQFPEHHLERVGIRKRIVGGDRNPVGVVLLEPTSQTDIAAGTEAQVGTGHDEFGIAHE